MKIKIDKNCVCPLCDREISGVPLEKFNLRELNKLMLPLLKLQGFEVRLIKRKKITPPLL